MVPHTSITDESLARFAELKSLRFLTLAGTKISNAGVPVFATHPTIDLLNFEKTAIADAGLAQLPQSLTSLYLHSTNVTDNALPHLLRLPKLTTIKVMGAKVTKVGLESWHKALPKCRIEWDDGVFEPSAKVERDHAKRLLELGASIDVVIANVERRVDRLADLPEEDFFVTGVNGGVHGDSKEPLLAWNRLPQLKHVLLGQSGATNADLRLLGECSELVRVDVGECSAITDEGVAHLKQLKKLEWLDLLGTQLTDRGLDELRGLTGLRVLNLIGTKITDAGMPAIAEFMEKFGWKNDPEKAELLGK